MKIQLNQSQALTLNMTQNLSQSIELLRYSNDELYEFLRQEALENPLFELRTGNQEKQFNFDQFSHKKESTCERTQLIEQIRWLPLDELEKKHLEYLVLSLDEAGYLHLTDEELSKLLNIELAQVSFLVKQLQLLEPIGIGVRNLKERLSLQLDVFFPNEYLSKQMVENSLIDLANRNYPNLTKEYGVTKERINEAIKVIQSLNPRPVNLSTNETELVTPDIVVEKDESGKMTYLLNDYYVPDLYFNESYALQMKESAEMKAYVRKQYDRFKWIRLSLMQRKETITKIMDTLLDKQSKFFTDGFKELRPLTLMQVAREINMHESTISRATTNKFLQTPLGTVYLKDLFQTGLRTLSGEELSSVNIKSRLKEIINKEDKSRPLSDQKIVDNLVGQGIDISRRTVAKYRNELKIPASSKRKLIQL